MNIKTISPAYLQTIQDAFEKMDCMFIKEYGIILCSCSTGLPLDGLQNHLKQKHNLLCKDTSSHINLLKSFFRAHPKQPCIWNAEEAKHILPKISGGLPLPGIPVHHDGILCAFRGCGHIVTAGNIPHRVVERMKRHWKVTHEDDDDYRPCKPDVSYQRIFAMLPTYTLVQIIKLQRTVTKEELFKAQFGSPLASLHSTQETEADVQERVHAHGKEFLQKLGWYSVIGDHDRLALKELVTLPTAGSLFHPLFQAVQVILKFDPSYNGLLELREALCKWRNR